jgi:hypothetical protein
MADYMANFDSKEITDAVMLFYEEIKKLGTADEVFSIMEKGLDFAKAEMLSFSPKTNNGMAINLEKYLLGVTDEALFPKDIYSANLIMDYFVNPNLLGFDKRSSGKSMLSNIKPLVRFFTLNAHKIFAIYQKFFSSSDRDQDKDEMYLKKMIKGVINPFENRSLGLMNATRSLAEMMGHPKLGKWKGMYDRMLFNKKYQMPLLNVLGYAGKVDRSIYLSALHESKDLLPATHNLLKLVDKNIEWRENSSEDLIFGLGGALRISEPNSLVLEKNVDLMDIWLSFKAY